ncbi:MAG: GAF domain-containing protein [Bdellovibrionales bacterium]|nr:GAF domain-containing protein [Bdellovibrionales bacterium]
MEQGSKSISDEVMEEKVCNLLRQFPFLEDAFARLEKNLPKNLHYHSAKHTREVLRDVLLFAEEDNLDEREKTLLGVAATFHDIGFLEKPIDNEWIAAAEARRALEKAEGFSEAEIQRIEAMILDTQLVQTALGATQLPSDSLARYLLDADLSNLGREDFFQKTELLRLEHGVERALFMPEALKFLENHEWLTPAANKLRRPQQLKNIEVLKNYLENHEAPKDVDLVSSDVGLGLSRLLFLSQLPLLLNSSLSTERVMEVALGYLQTMTGAKAATIFLLNDDQTELTFWAMQGGDSSRLKNKTMPANKGIVGWVVKHQEPVMSTDVRNDSRFFDVIDREGSFETLQLLCVPLSVRGGVKLGALQVLNRIGPEPFSPADLIFVERFGQQLSIAIDNARLFEQSNRMRKMLETLERRKGEMISVLAHEFRTPLNVIQASADLLSFGGALDETTRSKMAETLMSGVRRLTQLTSQLHALSQLQAGSVRLEKEEVSLAELVEVVKERVRVPMSDRRLQFLTEVSDPTLAVHADKSLLGIVLLNLVGNAIRFTPDNGCITLSVKSDSGMAVFSVTDTGIGIPEDEIPLIFEKFYEVGDSLEHSSGQYEFRSGGLGLGLPTSLSILKAHGSDLLVESKVGSGSTFRFHLPLPQVSS